jgi:dTDP-4-amino-4,6-dideoxygalactose transaminase
VIAEEDVGAVLDCLRSGWLTMGPRIQAFEEALAAAAGVPYALAVSSGAAALELCLRAAGVQPGDAVEVGTSPSVDMLTAVRACGAEAVPAGGVAVEDAGGDLRLGVPIAGLARCVTFAPGSQIVVGEGGAVLTHDEALAKQVRSLRSHAMTSVTWDRHRGHAESYDILDIGFNYRMDEARAALGASQLRRLLAGDR